MSLVSVFDSRSAENSSARIRSFLTISEASRTADRLTLTLVSVHALPSVGRSETSRLAEDSATKPKVLTTSLWGRGKEARERVR